MKNYIIVMWSERDDRGTAIELWHGPNMIRGILIIFFIYQIKVINNYCLITLQKSIDPELEAGGIMPKIILRFGNKDIKIFKCVHSLYDYCSLGK